MLELRDSMGDEEGKMDRIANFSGGRKLRPVAGSGHRKNSYFKSI